MNGCFYALTIHIISRPPPTHPLPQLFELLIILYYIHINLFESGKSAEWWGFDKMLRVFTVWLDLFLFD